MSTLGERVKTARKQQTGATVAGEVVPAGTGPEIDQRTAAQLSGYNVTVGLLRERQGLLGRAAPVGGPTGEQLITDAIMAMSVVKGLDECEPRTIIGAVVTCAQLGLRIGGALGQAYVLPFRNYETGRREATFVLGYKGLVLLAQQSGMVRGVTARTVFEKELGQFRLSWHENRDELRHDPWLLDNPGAPRLYYARVLLAEGGYEISRPINRDDMLAHRQRYVRIKSGPWFDDRGVPGDGFEAMAHKTCLKRLGRNLPLSAGARRAIAADGGVRVDDNPEAPADQVTEQHGEAEAEPGQSGAPAEAAYDEQGWPAGATTERPAAGS